MKSFAIFLSLWRKKKDVCESDVHDDGDVVWKMDDLNDVDVDLDVDDVDVVDHFEMDGNEIVDGDDTINSQIVGMDVANQDV